MSPKDVPWEGRETTERATEVRFYRPKGLPNPYPSGRWDDIREFSYDSDLHLLRLSDGLPGIPRSAQYIVGEPYTVSFRLDTEKVRRSITVPKGMLTDLASVPRCFRWYAGRVGPHLEAAIVHDFLYVAWHDQKDMCSDGRMRFFADRIMLAAMKAAGMRGAATVIYHAVRTGGRSAFKRCRRYRYVDLDFRPDRRAPGGLVER